MVVAAAAVATSPETPPTLSLLLPVYLSLPLFLSLAATIWFPQFRLLSLSLSLALSLSLSFPSTLSQMILSSPVNVKKTWKKKKKTKLFCFLNLGLKKRHRLSSLSCISSLRQVSPRLLLLLISLDEEASLTATFGLPRSRPVVFFDPLAPASGERGRKAPATRERSEEGENHQFLSNWPINSQLRAPVCFSLSTAGRRNQRAENKGGTKGFIKRRRGKKRENKRTV